MQASCHCGRVQVTIPRKPDYVNSCNCTLCAKSGGLWAYFGRDEVTAIGETSQYQRQDISDPVVNVHFCPKCGSTTHWHINPDDHRDVAGVNMRLFTPSELKGITVHFQNGRDWDGQSLPQKLTADRAMGIDAHL